MTKKLRCSVIVCTLGKRNTLTATIRSILYNTVKPYELLIIHQGKINIRQILSRLHNRSTKIKYVHASKLNVSNAKNIGIKYAKGDVLMFTDDDCIADVLWIKNCLNHFNKNPTSLCLTGMVKPYQTAKGNSIFPGANFVKQFTFTANIKEAIPYRDTGIGNNISFRKRVFQKIGLFNINLGPGTISKSAEDTDIINRMLEYDIPISYSPNVIIYHNKWLTQYEEIVQQAIYSRGLFACCVNMFLFTKKRYYIYHCFYRIKERLFEHQIPFNRPHLRILSLFIEIYNMSIGLLYGVYICHQKTSHK